MQFGPGPPRHAISAFDLCTCHIFTNPCANQWWVAVAVHFSSREKMTDPTNAL